MSEQPNSCKRRCGGIPLNVGGWWWCVGGMVGNDGMSYGTDVIDDGRKVGVWWCSGRWC